MASVPSPLTDDEFTSAVELLRRIIPEDDFPAYSLEVSPTTVYTTLVTLWMLTLQRLGGGKSMAAIVKEVLTHNRDLLLENLRAKSDEMVQKELLCSVVAYNLVVQLRREAAKLAKVEPRRPSFTGVWTTMQTYLLQQPPCLASVRIERYDRALRSAAHAKLPLRSGRSYPRQAHPCRPKSTKFMKQKSKTKDEKVPKEIPK